MSVNELVYSMGLSFEAVWALFAGALVTFVVGNALAVYLLVQIPPNALQSDGPWANYRHSHRGWAVVIVKNILGLVLIVAGIAMLVLPGPGIVTIVMGLWFLDFPGKRRALKKLIGRPAVLRAINALRARFGKPPLEVESGRRARPPRRGRSELQPSSTR